jgi:hypothetical protein
MARDQITLDAGTITGRGNTLNPFIILEGVRDVRAIDGQAMGHAAPVYCLKPGRRSDRRLAAPDAVIRSGNACAHPLPRGPG